MAEMEADPLTSEEPVLNSSMLDDPEELVNHPEDFEIQVNNFLSILKKKGPTIDVFRKEYETLANEASQRIKQYQATKKTAKDLRSQITEIQADASETARSIEAYRESTEKYRQTNETMLGKISSMEKMEEDAKEEMAEKSSDIEEFKEKLKKGSGWTAEQLKEKQKIMNQEESLSRQLNSRTQALLGVRKELNILSQNISDTEKSRVSLDEENTKLEEKINSIEKITENKLKEKSKLEGIVVDVQSKVNDKKFDFIELKKVLRGEKENCEQIGTELSLCSATMETNITQYDRIVRDIQNQTEKLEKLVNVNKRHKQAVEEAKKEIQVHKSELSAIVKDNAKTVKLRAMAVDMLVEIEGERDLLEKKRDELKDKILALQQNEIRSFRKKIDSQKMRIDEYKRSKEISHKQLTASEKSSYKMKELILFNESCMKVLRNEIIGFQANLRRQRDQIAQILKDKERHEKECEEATRRHFTALEQLKLQDIQIKELQKQIISSTARLKQQQNLYEAVRSDRNLFSKKLLESQSSIESMRGKFRVMNHQIEQLKEDIIAKDHTLIKEHFQHHNVNKEKEKLRNEITKIKRQIYSSDHMIQNQGSEISKLTSIISEGEAERGRQDKEHDAVVAERDILGSQLIRRNKELETLHERMKLQKSSLRHGEYRYTKCTEETNKILKLLAEKANERNSLLEKTQCGDDLKQACIHAERDLLKERTKIRALTEEQNRALNVHRWRVLESSDPARYEMICKIQSLQKRLNEMNQNIIDKELKIQEKEKLYVELTNILQRQPGEEVVTQISTFSSNLTTKKQQLNAMTEELSMYKQQVDLFKRDIESIGMAMKEIKTAYLKGMKIAKYGGEFEYVGSNNNNSEPFKFIPSGAGNLKKDKKGSKGNSDEELNLEYDEKEDELKKLSEEELSELSNEMLKNSTMEDGLSVDENGNFILEEPADDINEEEINPATEIGTQSQ